MGCGASSPAPAPAPAAPASSPAPAPAPAPPSSAADDFLASVQLGESETKKVEQIKVGELKHLNDNPEDMATVEAVFAACDADGNGVVFVCSTDLQQRVCYNSDSNKHDHNMIALNPISRW